MGGRAGHMSHLYDDPTLTFGKLKEVFKLAASGKLAGTEKTDGQNISISYSVRRGEAVAIRNDDHAYMRGFNSDDLMSYMAAENPAFKSLRTGRSRKKRETPQHVRASYAQAMATFEAFAQSLPPELQLGFFGEDADIFYNAEVMSASSRNAINYDVESLLIHRVGHAAYDASKQDTVSMPREEAEEKAIKLEAYLESFYNNMEREGMALQVGAVIQLQNLSTGAIYDEAMLRLNKLMAAGGTTDDKNIGQFIIERLEKIVNQRMPNLNFEARKLLYRRMYAEYYDIKGGPDKRSRGIHNKGIFDAVPERTPEVEAQIKELIANSKQIIKDILEPLEDLIHDFSVEMLKSLDSAFILDNRKEVEELQKKISHIIQTVENSHSQEAKDFLAQQLKKLKSVEKIVTAAEGFVFDFDGHTYKFTGNFAPMNQLLGLQNFPGSRPGIPADLFDDLVPLNEAFSHKGDEFLFIPGGFKPPHKGHIHLISKATEAKPEAKPFLVTGETPRDSVTLQQSMDVLKVLLQDESSLNLDDISIITIPKGGLIILDEEGQPLKNNAGKVRYSNSPLQGIYNSALGLPKGTTVYIASSTADKQHGDIGKSILKARPDLIVKALQIEPLPGLDPNEKMSASKMREALLSGDLKTFKTFLPDDAQDKAEYIFTRILGGETQEQPEEEMPLAESFRASDLLGLIEEVINEENLAEIRMYDKRVGRVAPGHEIVSRSLGDWMNWVKGKGVFPLSGPEGKRVWNPGKVTKPKKKEDLEEMSTMAGGAIEGGAHGAKGGPWHGLDTEEENEKQKEQQKLTSLGEAVEIPPPPGPISPRMAAFLAREAAEAAEAEAVKKAAARAAQKAASAAVAAPPRPVAPPPWADAGKMKELYPNQTLQNVVDWRGNPNIFAPRQEILPGSVGDGPMTRWEKEEQRAIKALGKRDETRPGIRRQRWREKLAAQSKDYVPGHRPPSVGAPPWAKIPTELQTVTPAHIEASEAAARGEVVAAKKAVARAALKKGLVAAVRRGALPLATAIHLVNSRGLGDIDWSPEELVRPFLPRKGHTGGYGLSGTPEERGQRARELTGAVEELEEDKKEALVEEVLNYLINNGASL